MDEDVKVSANSRAKRTLVQGLVIDLLIAIAAVLLVWLPDADIYSKEAWLMLGTSVVKSGLTAVASWVMRLKVAPPD